MPSSGTWRRSTAARAGARVERVLVRGGRVVGVLVAGQGEIMARTVVCDVTPHALVALARDALPGGYVRRLVRFRYGHPTLKVDWALDGPIPWEAPDARRAGTVHVGGEADEIMTAVGALRDGRLPERPFLLAGQQSIADPTRAPAGRHTAWAYTRVPHGIDWDIERPRAVERERAVGRERAVERELAVERMEAQIERFAPGFRDSILARDVMTPPDLQARDANLVDGDVGGGSYALDQLVFRPIPALSSYRTPVRGLYLASASTFPGGGVHGVPGHAAARQALLDDRLAAVRRVGTGVARRRP
jgi:phytoene dehydrogenase-like protein